jgi:hypothetical protein
MSICDHPRIWVWQIATADNYQFDICGHFSNGISDYSLVAK